MSGPGAIPGEMPGFPFPGRPGGEPDEPLLDMIIARRALPPDAPLEMHDLARMLAALAGPGEPGELAGEAAARVAFAGLASPAGISPAACQPVRHRRSRPSRRLTPSRLRVAVTLVAAAAGISVLAAYADVLPTPVQQLAHVAVAAPPPHHSGQPLSAAPNPSPAGSTAAGSPAPSARPAHPAPGPAARSSRPAAWPTRPPWGWTQWPVHPATSPSCALSPELSQQPQIQASGSAASPYWSQAERCSVPILPSHAATGPTLPPQRPSAPGRGQTG
jgi:hypothetical protein